MLIHTGVNVHSCFVGSIHSSVMREVGDPFLLQNIPKPTQSGAQAGCTQTRAKHRGQTKNVIYQSKSLYSMLP